MEDEMNIREGKKQRRREQKMRRRGQTKGSSKYKKWRRGKQEAEDKEDETREEHKEDGNRAEHKEDGNRAEQGRRNELD